MSGWSDGPISGVQAQLDPAVTITWGRAIWSGAFPASGAADNNYKGGTSSGAANASDGEIQALKVVPTAGAIGVATPTGGQCTSCQGFFQAYSVAKNQAIVVVVKTPDAPAGSPGVAYYYPK